MFLFFSIEQLRFTVFLKCLRWLVVEQIRLVGYGAVSQGPFILSNNETLLTKQGERGLIGIIDQGDLLICAIPLGLTKWRRSLGGRNDANFAYTIPSLGNIESRDNSFTSVVSQSIYARYQFDTQEINIGPEEQVHTANRHRPQQTSGQLRCQTVHSGRCSHLEECSHQIQINEIQL